MTFRFAPRAIYANTTARFDGTARALTESELRRAAPSVFAVDPHHSRSERFQPIPTFEIIKGLAQAGFQVVGAKQSSARDSDRREFTKHLLRLRKIEQGKAYQTGDTVCEVLLKNANDGTSAYELMSGLFRIACLNSLVSQVGTLESVKVRHTGSQGDVMGKVIDGTFTVIDAAQQALAAPANWSALTLDRDERQIFANAAHALRFDVDENGEATTPIKPVQMLNPRRFDDQGRDLWTTFNVVQENAIRGGLTAEGRDANNRPRRVTTRGINGIDQDVKLNRALFILADQMAQLKGAAPLAMAA